MLADITINELTDEQITEIFSWTDPVNIPAEFIQIARLITPQGFVLYFDGPEYRNYIDTLPKGMYIGNIEIALNIDKFSQDVMSKTRNLIKKGFYETIEN